MKTIIQEDTYYDNNITLIKDDGPDLEDNEYWALMVKEDTTKPNKDKSLYFNYDNRDVGLQCTFSGIIYISKDMSRIRSFLTLFGTYFMKIRVTNKNKCYIIN